MPAAARINKVKTETDIAVLQVQVSNLDQKFVDLKDCVDNLDDKVEHNFDKIHDTLRNFQEENQRQHKEVNGKINSLEKWRWMIMGGAATAGALGFHVIAKILGM